ncbi:MAG: tRNA epoxyqueuosine(34) reductase QueG [Verrucomicrobiales bacterium]
MSEAIFKEPAFLRGRIRQKAQEIGFDDCRFARLAPPTHGREFQSWIEDGCQGDMQWMARGMEKRLDPQKVLPGARTIIVVALNYFQKEQKRSGEALSSRAECEARPARQSLAPPQAARLQPVASEAAWPPAKGIFARYAWGDDYHGVIEAKLRELSTYLAEHGGRQRVYVDTGPVLERDFASDAGLGWNGKSTVQIHPKLGTWFFLGEILTTLDLPIDPPMRDHCGKCTRCLDACPTGAITSPHRVDARRCISYLTIEYQGAIPLEFRRAMGARIFGCDDCLAACPWNRFAQESREAAFAARDFVNDYTLRDFLFLSDEAFRTLFKNSPVRRTKRAAFLRNVCVALGNVGDAGDLPALRTAATDPHPLIAEHAQWAIGEIESRMAVNN